MADASVATALGDPTEVMERRQVEGPAPGTNEVRVAVEAFCLNFNDIDVICGRCLTLPLPTPFVPGMESVGADVLEQAEADGLAHLGRFALHERARLRPGETLMVRAGAGRTGSGAVQGFNWP